jgi:peptide/nickel transport system substrate-binding protein
MTGDSTFEQLTDRLRRGLINRKTFLLEATALGISAATARQALAASSKTSRTRAPVQGGNLVYAFQQPFRFLDPTKSGLQIEEILNLGMVDYLMWRRPGDSRLYPGLATAFQVSPDAKTYTFKLRRDVKFHDGTPFNAQALQFYLDHCYHAPPTATGLQNALGASYSHTRVVDDYTAQVVFSAPFSSFLITMATAFMGPQSPTALKKYGSDYQHHIAGTGPFMLKELVVGDHVTMVRNPDYAWAPSIFRHRGPAYLDSITFRQVPADISRVVALQSGQVNLIDNVPPQNFALFKNDPSYKTRIQPGPGVPWEIALNMTLPPTNELVVRQAIEYAANQTQISQLIFNGLAPAVHTLLTPGTPGYSPSTALYQYNPARANALLDGAGWKMGSDGIRAKNGAKLRVSSVYVANFGIDGMATVLQQQLKAVGIDMVNQAFEPAETFGVYYKLHKMNLAWEFYNDPDPAAALDLFYGPDQLNTGGNAGVYLNPTVTALFKKGQTITNPMQRAQVYEQISAQILKDAASLPIVNRSVILTAQAKVALEDVYFTIQGDPYFYDVSLTS